MAPFRAENIRIPFCKPDYEIADKLAVDKVIDGGLLEGGGKMTRLCENLIKNDIGCLDALIVPSCTSALEMMALALDFESGDEIIMPSFTFVSTANAFALRGATPVFVDIDEDTLNIDPACAEAAITEKTRAIMLVHYAGVACDIPHFQQICEEHNLVLLEDGAQCIHSFYEGKALGSFGQFGALSFHHTKNISCGEGGALLINNKAQVNKAKFIRDKGTNRPDFLNGSISKYEWQTLGSSYLLSELSAAVLSSQLKRVKQVTQSRLKNWQTYYEETKSLCDIRVPKIPKSVQHNAHIFHLRLPTPELRDDLVKYMREEGIMAAPHYVPLHLTPAGQQFGRSSGHLKTTVEACSTLVRLPLYSSMTEGDQQYVLEHLNFFLQRSVSSRLKYCSNS